MTFFNKSGPEALKDQNSEDINLEFEEKTLSSIPNADIEKYVGKKMRLFRQLKALSQSDCAACLGITFQQYQKYESGKNRIPISRLMKLAELFGVKMPVFFENTVNVMFQDIMNPNIKSIGNNLKEEVYPIGVSSNQRSTNFNVSDLDEEATLLLRNFRSIKDPNVRKNILTLVKSLSNENKA
jgi:transcriptional regulator with XRE-family HTH domain